MSSVVFLELATQESISHRQLGDGLVHVDIRNAALITTENTEEMLLQQKTLIPVFSEFSLVFPALALLANNKTHDSVRCNVNPQ